MWPNVCFFLAIWIKKKYVAKQISMDCVYLLKYKSLIYNFNFNDTWISRKMQLTISVLIGYEGHDCGLISTTYSQRKHILIKLYKIQPLTLSNSELQCSWISLRFFYRTCQFKVFDFYTGYFWYAKATRCG